MLVLCYLCFNRQSASSCLPSHRMERSTQKSENKFLEVYFFSGFLSFVIACDLAAASAYDLSGYISRSGRNVVRVSIFLL